MKRSSLVITPATGFLALTAVMLGFTLAQRAGSIDATLAARGIGACVGAMTLLAGNFLPKLRPLAAKEGRLARIMKAERRAGWILVVMGLALVGLFVAAPIDLARRVSGIVVLAGVGWIELDWIWTAWISRPAAAEPVVRRASGEQRIVAGWMLFGLAYVLVTASLKFTLGSAGWARDLGAWIVIGSTIAYAIAQVFLGKKRRHS